MNTEIGYYKYNSNSNSIGYEDIGLNTIIDIPISDKVIINHKGAMGTKKVITMAAIQLIRLYDEYKLKHKIVEQRVKELNRSLDLKTYKIEIKSTHKQIFHIIQDWNISSSIALLAQLKYHYPKLFKRVWRAYNLFKKMEKTYSFSTKEIKQDKFSQLLRAGSEARNGESIFDRAFHHYTVHMNEYRQKEVI